MRKKKKEKATQQKREKVLFLIGGGKSSGGFLSPEGRGSFRKRGDTGEGEIRNQRKKKPECSATFEEDFPRDGPGSAGRPLKGQMAERDNFHLTGGRKGDGQKGARRRRGKGADGTRKRGGRDLWGIGGRGEKQSEEAVKQGGGGEEQGLKGGTPILLKRRPRDLLKTEGEV